MLYINRIILEINLSLFKSQFSLLILNVVVLKYYIIMNGTIKPNKEVNISISPVESNNGIIIFIVVMIILLFVITTGAIWTINSSNNDQALVSDIKNNKIKIDGKE